ncbi:MAG: anaerobic glycerol-3-phosphate dehydrogenase subunit GlpB [Thermodesulfobacteriota bacterium]
MHYDLIVIGAGLSGLMAAKTAVEAGAKTLIIGKGTGSLCLFSNTIDLLGSLPAGMKMSDGLGPWIKDHPEHPYSKLDCERIEQALFSFRSLFDSHYPLQSIDQENSLLLTGAGTYRPTYLIPPTMTTGASLKKGKVLIVGFKGFKDFYSDYVADQLKCRAIVIPLSEFEGREMSATAIAKLMGRESFRKAVARAVKNQMKGESCIGLPALLGIRDSLGAKRDLEEKIGAEVFEIPILPPSIPGMRIFRRFKEWFIQRGVTFLLGHSVSKAHVKGKSCEAIAVSHAPLSQSYSADRFLLATGRFIGGGLVADEEKIFEPLFNLPVMQPKSRDDWFSKSFFDHHAAHQSGILTDSSFQPVDQKGELLLDNVWIAGSILAGHDCVQEKSREGIEIATGYWAAKNAFQI